MNKNPNVEYNLTGKELAVFNVAKILAKWSKWEFDSDSLWPNKSWGNLKTFIGRIKIDELRNKIEKSESEYKEMDNFKRLDCPHRVYNEIRNELIYQTE